ncbi:hypothetical protein TCAL_07437 [Tigriopus californicus]|uniref:C2H2-type domain-containing protein n=1 Tax=Tigriopus californicus TaxID=6832 RepID=A0A553N9U1_TIGCA|nr:zinc finger protein 62-like [Tigriopus californicus]TRY62193.1 hypothetical protein TCAL_07437 [Tigriopus californicus]|eukprot:TCALIF_07437-PA protein Name:"Similar to ZNF564 Zinc finger protein 564 (Homo sapiens)" AED:0.59 eAED:0.59 QI:0/-1/0/1/-1/1/1/0/676
MDFTAALLTTVREHHNYQSVDLLHLVVQNWIVFQRSTFDYFDDQGDPYTSHLFLIEVCTGRFIHRAQGMKLEEGITLDMNRLASKLLEAFQGTRLCQGWSVQDVPANHPTFRVREYPVPRCVSNDCQHLYKPCKSEVELGQLSPSKNRSICPPCEKMNDGSGEALDITIDDDLNDSNEELTDEHPDAISYDILQDLEDCEPDLKIFSESDIDEDDLALKRPRFAQPEKMAMECAFCSNESSQSCDCGTKDEKPMGDLHELDGISYKKKAKRQRKEFKCNHCSKVFPTKSFYARHQREKRLVGCPHCSKKIVTFWELKQHLSRFHPDSSQENLHPLWDNDEDEATMQYPKICFTCDRLCNGNIMMSRHKELYHELGDHKCAECLEPCLTFYDLIIHSYQAHSKAIPHISPYTQGLHFKTHTNGKVEVTRQNFACHFCFATFKFDSEHTKHMRKCHAWGQFECRACDEVGHYSQDISAHMRDFHPQKPEVKCPNCSSIVTLQTDEEAFIVHYRGCKFKGFKKTKTNKTSSKIHRGTRRRADFQCHYCGKEYASKTTLQNHVQQHEGVERFKCTFCDYGTNVKAVLIDHEKHHLRERGLTNEDTGMQLYYDCDQCDKKFAQQSGLRSHRKRVHQGIKKNHPCKDCGEVFTNLQGYYRHKRQRHGFVSKQIGRKGRKPLD